MRTLWLTVLLLALTASAQADPALPDVPRGFDEGRTALLQEAAEGLIRPDQLVTRLFEEADLEYLAAFTHRHLTTAEKRALETALKLAPGLPAADAAATLKLLRDKPVSAAGLRSALATIAADGRKLPALIAWLYARGINFRALQHAMNGERMDPLMLLRDARAAGADKLIPLLWQLNLDDGRVEAAGVHDGVQIVAMLLHLGWREADFGDALARLKLPELTEPQKRAIAWGDANLLWATFGSRLPESELKRAAALMLRDTDPKLLQQAITRSCDSCLRWFRTGGGGVVDVYSGPWPDAKGQPAPPGPKLLPDAEGDFEGEFSAEAKAHFGHKGDTLTVVIYDDGSARAFIRRAQRPALARPADSPLGGTASATQLYEGRITLRGRAGLLNEVYAHEGTPGPADIEFANVQRLGQGALLTADIDDGVNLTPILLRRASRLTACE